MKTQFDIHLLSQAEKNLLQEALGLLERKVFKECHDWERAIPIDSYFQRRFRAAQRRRLHMRYTAVNDLIQRVHATTGYKVAPPRLVMKKRGKS